MAGGLVSAARSRAGRLGTVGVGALVYVRGISYETKALLQRRRVKILYNVDTVMKLLFSSYSQYNL